MLPPPPGLVGETMTSAAERRGEVYDRVMKDSDLTLPSFSPPAATSHTELLPEADTEENRIRI